MFGRLRKQNGRFSITQVIPRTAYFSSQSGESKQSEAHFSFLGIFAVWTDTTSMENNVTESVLHDLEPSNVFKHGVGRSFFFFLPSHRSD